MEMRMRDIIRGLALVALSGAVVACELPASEVACEGVSPVEGEITLGPVAQGELVRGDLLVRGRAEHPDGLTVRRVEVAGITASSGVGLDEDGTRADGFNFSSWEARVPFDQLQALAAQRGNGLALVLVEATDACDVTTTLGSFEVALDPTPDVEVTSLAMSVEVPGFNEDGAAPYLPVEGNQVALLTLTGNAKAAGADVALDASLGEFEGAELSSDGGASTVTLRGDGEGPATASVFFSSTQPGTALITAAAADQLAQSSVVVSGAPTLIPSQATLRPGQRLQVTILTDGLLSGCRAEPVAGADVTSGAGSLEFDDAVTGGTFEVVVDEEGVEAPFNVRVVCFDAYGQSSNGVYSVEP